jgi:predicted metal-binding membrane protein
MSVPASDRAFLAAAALLFAGSAAVTIAWGGAMSAMGNVPMPGGWNLSMAWLPACGRTWSATAAAFLGMWIAMTAAMMLPSLVPMLRRYRRSIVPVSRRRRDRLTALVGLGYFAVWILLGVAVFPLGAAMTSMAIASPSLARAAPLAAGIVVLMAGALQLTAWKTRRLTCCREDADCCRLLPAEAGTAWRHGLRLGLDCCLCCAGLTAALLAVGVMDPAAMTAVAAAVTVERRAADGRRAARAIGVSLVATGSLLIAQAAAFA